MLSFVNDDIFGLSEEMNVGEIVAVLIQVEDAFIVQDFEGIVQGKGGLLGMLR